MSMSKHVSPSLSLQRVSFAVDAAVCRRELCPHGSDASLPQKQPRVESCREYCNSFILQASIGWHSPIWVDTVSSKLVLLILHTVVMKWIVLKAWNIMWYTPALLSMTLPTSGHHLLVYPYQHSAPHQFQRIIPSVQTDVHPQGNTYSSFSNID